MKCPDCHFTCSDLRDLCPKCTLDLRPFKKSVGLPVTYPDLTPEELKKKLGTPSSSPLTTQLSEPQREPRTLFDTLQGIFGKKSEEPTPPQPSPSPPLSSETQTTEDERDDNEPEELPFEVISPSEAVAVATSATEEISEQAPEPTPEPESSENEFDFTFGELEETPPPPADIPSGDEEEVLQSPLSFSEEEKEEKEEEDDEPAAEDLPQETLLVAPSPPPVPSPAPSTPSPASSPLNEWLNGGPFPTGVELTSSSEARFPSLLPQRLKKAADHCSPSRPTPPPASELPPAPSAPAPEVPAASEPAPKRELREPQRESSTPAPAPTSTPAPPPPNPAPPNDEREEARLLFEELLNDLPEFDEDGFEISASSALQEKSDETIRLLFQLASESFVDTSIEERFRNTGLASTTREVVSQAAEKQLKKAEEAMRAPVFDLKTASGGGEASDIIHREPHSLASPKQRLFAWCYDMLCMFGIAFVSALAWSYFESKPLFRYLLTPESPFHEMALTFTLGNFAATAALTFLLYPAISYLSAGTSLGEKFVDCALFEVSRKKRASLANAYTRHLCLPVTTPLTLLGCLPTFLGGLSIADRLSRTALCEQDEG